MTQLTPEEIVRAWQDQAFYNQLTEEQKSNLPSAPTAIAELSDLELDVIAGGAKDCKPATCTTSDATICVDSDGCPVDCPF